MSETVKCDPVAALRSIRKVAADVLEHPGLDREKALRYIVRRADEALTATPSDDVHLDLSCAIEIGRHRDAGMSEVAAHHLEAALRAIVRDEVSAARRRVAHGASVDDVARLRALSEDRSYGLHTPTREWLRDLAVRLEATEAGRAVASDGRGG